MTEAAQPLDGTAAARVLVAGASGFAGALAAQLVWTHPRLELTAVTARSDVGARLDQLYPRYRVPLLLEELDPEKVDVDAALVAYPHGAAALVVAVLRKRGIKVVDLSADFRLRDPEVYRAWYGDHPAPGLIEEAAYGLTELNRQRVAGSELVANPGCYPTATLLALAPLAEAGLIEDVVIDAKSGVSGAGRGSADATQFVTVTENAVPYGTDGHRHEPEIQQELAGLGVSPTITFVPHLLPLDQGELVSCYVRSSAPLDREELELMYRSRFDGEPFVEVVSSPPGVRDVRDTNLCRIHVTTDKPDGRVMVFAAIDNLWKGAAGQAIQNLNVMLGLPEEQGIS